MASKTSLTAFLAGYRILFRVVGGCGHQVRNCSNTVWSFQTRNFPLSTPVSFVVGTTNTGTFPRTVNRRMMTAGTGTDQPGSCEPCASLDGSSVLDNKQIQEELSRLPLWYLEAETETKTKEGLAGNNDNDDDYDNNEVKSDGTGTCGNSMSMPELTVFDQNPQSRSAFSRQPQQVSVQ